jgi:hypothetical protein
MIRQRIIAHLKAQNWGAVGIDFLIVVVGIVLALQITEWNEDRHDRIRERAYLVRIAADLGQSVADIENAIAISDRREALGRLLIESVDDAGLVVSDPGRFVLALHKGAYTYSPGIRSHTFDEIKSVGDLGLIRDKSLLAGITEFYTEVREWSQWDYLRASRQTEFMRRGAGILSYEQLSQATLSEAPDASEEAALAAHARMLERPEFIAWLPTVANRAEDTRAYRGWLERAIGLRVRIEARLAAD